MTLSRVKCNVISWAPQLLVCSAQSTIWQINNDYDHLQLKSNNCVLVCQNVSCIGQNIDNNMNKWLAVK